MEIKNLRKNNGPGRARAFFSVCWPGRMTINGCSLVEGKDGGYFVGLPQTPYTDKQGNKKYSNVVWIDDKDLLKKILDAVLELYGGKEAPDFDIPF